MSINDSRTRLRNVIQGDGRVWKPDPDNVYGDHLQSVLLELSEIWPDFYNFEFQLHAPPIGTTEHSFPREGRRTILIYMADELGTVPLELGSRFYAILKTYWPYENSLRNFFSFPMGYSNALKHAPAIPFESRKWNASYAGNFFPNRLDFFRQFGLLRYAPPWPIKSVLGKKFYYHILKKLLRWRPGYVGDWLKGTMIYFSGNFGKGLPREDYAAMLANSKIALCPRGFYSAECFRVFEAMKLGCVVVSDILPPSIWYKDSPIIQTDNWLNIRRLVEDLLSEPEELFRIAERTKHWYEAVCSDRAAARFLASELQARDNQ